MRCGVWAGRAQLKRPGYWLDLALAAGCSRVDIIVNDLSKCRVRPDGKVYSGRLPTRKHWSTYSAPRLLELAKQASDRGMQVNTLFWCVPTLQGVTAAADFLNEFAEQTAIHSHVLDAEEPITQSSYAAYDGEVKECAHHLLSSVNGRVGVTHIGYAPVSTVKPFVSAADYAIPQTYLTTSSGLSAHSVKRLVSRATQRLGARRVVGSFAMYRQPKQPTIEKTIDALRDCGIRECVGWHASGLKKYGKHLARAIHDPEC